jgi:hypothetical protein
MMNDLEKRKKSPSNPSFDQKVKEARSSKAKGELITVNPENVWLQKEVFSEDLFST